MPVPSSAHEAAVATRQVERVYAGLARVYDQVFDRALRPGRIAAVRRLDLSCGKRVLEVGVGTGLSLGTYPAGAEITAIDISEPMLERARRQADKLPRNRISIHRMDAQAMAFADGSFDHVIAPYVISVVPDPHRVMQEIRRVCRPGGTVIVVNHFVHENSWVRAFERCATPLTRRIGFRLDTPAETVVAAPGFDLQSVQAVNLFGLWKLAVLTRRESA
jgi:phosphatidylethanolamine/phosphatidyl-N-methylethanolamine N-methyltransferase